MWVQFCSFPNSDIHSQICTPAHAHPVPAAFSSARGEAGSRGRKRRGRGGERAIPQLAWLVETTTSACESSKHPASHSRHLHKADLSLSLSQSGCLMLPCCLCWSQTHMVSHVRTRCFPSLLSRIKTRSLPSLFFVS